MQKEISKIDIFSEIKALIESSKQQVTVSVNAAMSLLYWKIGKRINEEVLKNERAEYGKQVVATLSRQLETEYGTSFLEKNLRRMMQFANVFPEQEIVVSLIRQLSWTHILAILDYYIDLLFYHRRLKCLVAIDLKIGEFEAGFKGQMELYLRYLQKNEMVEGENLPIGLILCSGKNEEHIELLQLDTSNIRVAEYLTLLPSQKVLQEKLHKAIEIAKHRMAMREIE
ncbi:MAG: DUF1016 family protein [Leptospiraceae bacterium]|nr:DUF1016 family protein [Leptospiraceae bacterium]